jgi:hydroxymethylpyrimidine/phosphomethylpyrimidine kinase
MTGPPRILSIAGSDSSGGAGIQADIKTITMLGGYAMTAITAVTAQDTTGVSAIAAIDGDMILAQIAACVEDIGVDAIKIGMLGSEEAVRNVAAALVAAPEIAARSPLGQSRKNAPPGVERFPIVLDPVMVSTSDALLADKVTIEAMRNRLMPLATLLTPNLPELEVLSGTNLRELGQVRQAALDLADEFGFHVLAKGGHSRDATVIDLLVSPGGEMQKFEHARVDTKHTHGTGCTVSSAITTYLGAGFPLAEAVRRARAFTRVAIINAPGFGLGSGPIGHQAVGRKG